MLEGYDFLGYFLRFSVRRGCNGGHTRYNDCMSNKSNNGTNKIASNKGRRGPRPIMTVAMLREKMLKELMLKETRKIERKMTKLLKRERTLLAKLESTRIELDGLREMRVEYTAEVNR